MSRCQGWPIWVVALTVTNVAIASAETIKRPAIDQTNALARGVLQAVAEGNAEVRLQLAGGLWRLSALDGTAHVKIVGKKPRATLIARIRSGEIESGTLSFQDAETPSAIHAVFDIKQGGRCSIGIKTLRIGPKGTVTIAPEAWLDTVNHGHNVDACLRLMATLRLEPLLDRFIAGQLFAAPTLCRGDAIPCTLVTGKASKLVLMVSAKPDANSSEFLRLATGARLDLGTNASFILRDGRIGSGEIQFGPAPSEFGVQLDALDLVVLTAALQNESAKLRLGSGTTLKLATVKGGPDEITAHGELKGTLESDSQLAFASAKGAALALTTVEPFTIETKSFQLWTRAPEGLTLELTNSSLAGRAMRIQIQDTTGKLAGVIRAETPLTVSLANAIWPATGKATGSGSTSNGSIAILDSSLSLQRFGRMSIATGTARVAATFDTARESMIQARLDDLSSELSPGTEFRFGDSAIRARGGTASAKTITLSDTSASGELYLSQVSAEGALNLSNLLAVDIESAQLKGRAKISSLNGDMSLSELKGTLRAGTMQWCTDSLTPPLELAGGEVAVSDALLPGDGLATGTFTLTTSAPASMRRLALADVLAIDPSEVAIASAGKVKVEKDNPCLNGPIAIATTFGRLRTEHNIPLLSGGRIDSIVLSEPTSASSQRFEKFKLRGRTGFATAETTKASTQKAWDEGRAAIGKWLVENRNKHGIADADPIRDRQNRGGVRFAPETQVLLDWHLRVDNLIQHPIDSPDCDLDVTTSITLKTGVPTAQDITLETGQPRAFVPDCSYSFFASLAHVILAPIAVPILNKLHSELRAGRTLGVNAPSSVLGLRDTWFESRNGRIEKAWLADSGAVEGIVVAERNWGNNN